MKMTAPEPAARPSLREMSRVLGAHHWTSLAEWVAHLEHLAELTDEAIDDLHRLARGGVAPRRRPRSPALAGMAPGRPIVSSTVRSVTVGAAGPR